MIKEKYFLIEPVNDNEYNIINYKTGAKILLKIEERKGTLYQSQITENDIKEAKECGIDLSRFLNKKIDKSSVNIFKYFLHNFLISYAKDIDEIN